MFTIHSVSSSRELIFSAYEGEHFHVELKSIEFSGTTKVWTHDGASGLNNFFKELASFEKPWQGNRGMESLEGEFQISASCTKLGSVVFSVELSGRLGELEEWHLKAQLETELGQLGKIAKDAELFFQEKG